VVNSLRQAAPAPPAQQPPAGGGAEAGPSQPGSRPHSRCAGGAAAVVQCPREPLWCCRPARACTLVRAAGGSRSWIPGSRPTPARPCCQAPDASPLFVVPASQGMAMVWDQRALPGALRAHTQPDERHSAFSPWLHPACPDLQALHSDHVRPSSTPRRRGGGSPAASRRRSSSSSSSGAATGGYEQAQRLGACPAPATCQRTRWHHRPRTLLAAPDPTPHATGALTPVPAPGCCPAGGCQGQRRQRQRQQLPR